jgi:hypothetical protein
MKRLLKAFYFSFPVQLMLMHLKRYQLLLFFWAILTATITGSFMKNFGAASLFLSPEYLGEVHFLSGCFTGFALGIFIMSWNITSFLLISHHFKFLAATSSPFRNFTFNNMGLPVLFIFFYIYQLVEFTTGNELIMPGVLVSLISGFLCGLISLFVIAMGYMAGSEKAIKRSLKPDTLSARPFFDSLRDRPSEFGHIKQIRVDSYFTGLLKFRQPRQVGHYNQPFLDRVFKRHHFAAVIAIIIAFLSLMIYGFFLDLRPLQLPAAASILVLFSILIAASGAYVFWLKNWSIPVLILILLVMNKLIGSEFIDIRNKAFGLDYNPVSVRPEYNDDQLKTFCSPAFRSEDSLQMIHVLENWKKRQGTDKPVLYFLNVSGGGTRSATFSFHTIRAIDSAMDGQFMKKLFMFTGASGGMLGTAYYRELYRRSVKGEKIDRFDRHYGEHIAEDLLNPIFSAMVSRDLVTPAQHFSVGPYRYVKDRAFAFEEQLNRNTGYLLNQQLKDYIQEEREALLPLGLFHSTITKDSRKLIICTQPVRYLMSPVADSSNGLYTEPDAVDYGSLFAAQNPYNLRLLTALRMNATFPYVLPNVWLPTAPVIDVMDAGIRDNFGLETTLRFLSVFETWIKENTSGITLVQIRDRKRGEARETEEEKPGLGDIVYKPFSLLQYNFLMLQDYYQESMLGYLQKTLPVRRFAFVYEPAPNRVNAALNFHLTAQEKKDVIEAVDNRSNRETIKRLLSVH